MSVQWFSSAETFKCMDERDYVQGVTILSRMAEAALKAGRAAEMKIERVKFRCRTLLNGDIHGVIGEPSFELPGPAGVVLSADMAGKPTQIAFIPDPNRPVQDFADSPTYPISGFCPTGPFASRMEHDTRDGTTFLWMLIEANKRSVAKDVPSKWKQPRIELVEIGDFAYRRQEMVVPGEFEIANLGVREFADRLYVLNEARYVAGDGGPATARILYSVHAD